MCTPSALHKRAKSHLLIFRKPHKHSFFYLRSEQMYNLFNREENIFSFQFVFYQYKSIDLFVNILNVFVQFSKELNHPFYAKNYFLSQ